MRKSFFVAGAIAIALGLGCWAYARLFGYLPNHIDDLTFVSIEPFNSPNTPANLQLRFRSNLNLRKFAEDSGDFGASADLSLCPFRRNPIVGMGGVTHNGIYLDAKPTWGCEWRYDKIAGCSWSDNTPGVRAEIAGRNQKGPFIYGVPFVYNGKQMETYQMTSGGFTARFIPMPKGPEDVCVQIHGNEGSPGFISNEFHIPKAALALAIEGATMPPDYSRGRK
jgi:hypothetical protein